MQSRTLKCIALIGMLGVVLLSSLSITSEPSNNWPSFRGPQATGVADGGETPTHWSVEPARNILWRTPLPGLGHSSPVIWGSSLFVTSALRQSGEQALRVGLYGDIQPVENEGEHRWVLYRFDKKTGKASWERTVHRGAPLVKRHFKSTHANPTPATDGRYVVVFFGSEGLFCYDFNGNLVWKKDLGLLDSGFFTVPDAQWGFSSSPVIHNGVVYVQCDVLTRSFVAALRLEDGKEIWRTSRTEVPTFSTPTVHEGGDRTLVLVNGWKHIGAYDAASGKEVWKLRGGGDIPVPTPVVAHGLAFITNAHGPGSPIFAVRLDAEGDITLGPEQTSNSGVVWSVPRGGAYMQTPLVYGDYLYVCRENGVLSCYRAKTGERIYQERLGDGKTGFSASAVAGGSKVYYTSEEGSVYVVKAGPAFEVLAANSLDEVTMATPAISEGALYFRTRGHLVAVR